jgi:hypothetical protein
VNEGNDAKLSINITGDELKQVGLTGQSLTWKKSPPLQQVAAQQQTLKHKSRELGTWYPAMPRPPSAASTH